MLSLTKAGSLTRSRHLRPQTKRRRYVSSELESKIEQLRQGDRLTLSRLITLVEGQHPNQKKAAALLMTELLKDKRAHSSSSFRIGLSGSPGVGKSTFIEVFGSSLIKKGFKVAVLAIDPSSTISGGSILGDKTRMLHLSAHPNAYVRPSPTRGSLGGIGKNTSEAIILCEAAGYDVILIETVGVGQSEVAVDSLVDMFVLLVPPAGGDELQGIKRGIMESADMIIVNKGDGDLVRSAKRAQYEYMSAIKLLTPKYDFWVPSVIRCSSVTQEGIDKVWDVASRYLYQLKKNGEFEAKRAKQFETWMWNIICEELETKFKNYPSVQRDLPAVIDQIREGTITPHAAATRVLGGFFAGIKNE